MFYLFNESLRIGQFPSAWKIATVAPLFKGGSRTDYDNNRPIWVLPCISKIMSESFVNIDLRNFAHEVGLIEQHQFAYSKFSSTTVTLLKVVDFSTFSIHDGLKFVCVFPDLRKAFDVIKHDILLAKLESYGIKGNALQRFNSYLLGRSEFAVRRDSIVELRFHPFGVPQGSFLGPTLFDIHINNISIKIACHNFDVALFADDTEIHFSSNDVGEAEYKINKDLNPPHNQWLSNNGLNL